jgi:hypothetical protein
LIEMSLNINSESARRALSIEDYYIQKQLATPSAWWNPAQVSMRVDDVTLRPDTIYIGEQNGRPTWETPVFDVSRYRTAKQLYREGKIDDDRLTFSPWLSPEWDEAVKIQADIHKYGRQAMNAYRSASGVVTSTDSTAINVIQILGEILGRDERVWNMEEAVTRVATPNLSLSVDSWQGFTASADVAEAVEAFPKKGKITRTEYLLKKDVAHIMITDEAQLRADRSIFDIHVNAAVQDMRRLKAAKIAVELESATDVAIGDWQPYTAEHSTRDPVDDIGVTADGVIVANNGNFNTIASHPRPFRDFFTNTHIQGTGAAANPTRFTDSQTVGNIPGLPGVTWYVSNLLTNTMVTIYDKRAIMLMQGPVRTAQYRNELRGVDAYVTRDYNITKIVDSTLIRNLTGASA